MPAITKLVKAKREKLGLTHYEFAELLGIKSDGEKIVRSWEDGEKKPTPAKLLVMRQIQSSVPFKFKNEKPLFKFIDLFAGIGGIRLPFQELGGKCVFTSEWDKFSQKTYTTNFGELPNGDITKILAKDIPEHDLLLGGFPCQAFSQAGLKRGFNDSRGTMFFEIQRILVNKRPKAFLLENVKQLRGHDKGRTLKTILDILEGNNIHEIPEDVPMSEEARLALTAKLNYKVFYKVLKASDFGIPQNRERIFIVGFDLDYFGNQDFEILFNWPEPPSCETRLGDILDDSSKLDEKYTLSQKLWDGHVRRKAEHKEKGNGFGYSLFNSESPYANTISARYYKDGSEILIDQSALNKCPRKLTPRECARLQGFPENYIVDAVSDGQSYKQFGNSVCVPVIRAVANKVIEAITNATIIMNGGKFNLHTNGRFTQLDIFKGTSVK
jgi:DNA (cytosine-5)-methyltransferase 1